MEWTHGPGVISGNSCFTVAVCVYVRVIRVPDTGRRHDRSGPVSHGRPMNPSDSLHIDENLARLLAAYDQGIGDADPKAPTLEIPRAEPPPERLVPGEAPRGPTTGPTNEGSLGDLFPDSRNGTVGLPPAPAQPGPHRIGRFELRRQLGKGGCGIVFLAFDPKLRREVALKIPRPELLLSPDARRRLVREALAAAEFDHPNLVPVYETGEIGPICYVATAFCPGQTLAEWLDRQAFPVPVRQVARVVAVLADAVQHAHDRGVLHRDLKPNNVILQGLKEEPGDQESPPGSCLLRGEHLIPRIVDFGLAKLAERGPAETATRQILGTPKYMAPEQAQARHEDVGPAADVYALGVILYELLTGRAPYDGPTDVEVLRQAVEGRMTPPRGLRPDVPRDLEAICLRATARTPANRYRTAIDFADDLRRFLDGLPTLARPLGALGRAARWLRRNDQAVALVVVSTIALIFLAFGVWRTSQTRRLISDKEIAARQEAERTRADQLRHYVRHVRDAFLSWRAGDSEQMAESLQSARGAASQISDASSFAAGYLSQAARAQKLAVPCSSGTISVVARSPDGARVVTGHPDGTLAVWETSSGALRATVQAHTGRVTHIAFLSGGSGVVTAGGERVARAWVFTPAGGLTPGPALPPLTEPIAALASSRDGTRLYLASAAGELLCCAGGPGFARRWATSTAGPVVALAVSPDGATLATATASGPVRLWNTETAAPCGEISNPGVTSILTFAPAGPDGWHLFVADRTVGTIRVFDRAGREVRKLIGHAAPVQTLDVTPDGKALVSGDADGCVRVWDPGTGSPRAVLWAHERPVRGVQASSDGRTLVTGAEDGLWKLWDLSDPTGFSVRGTDRAVTAIAIDPDSRGYSVGYADGAVEVWESRGGRSRVHPGNGRGPVVTLRYPPQGPPVGVELTERAVVGWEFGPTPRVLRRFEMPDRSPTVAELSADGSRVAVGDTYGRVVIWPLADRPPVGVFDTGVRGPVRHLSVSDNGLSVAALLPGYAVGVWDIGATQPRCVLTGHRDGVWLVRFLPGGDRLITSSRGGGTRVWNLSATQEEFTLLGQVGQVTALAVSPDVRTLVSGSSTGEVMLWDLRTGQELFGLRRHGGPIRAAEFSPDGLLLLTGGSTTADRGELAVWDAGKQ